MEENKKDQFDRIDELLKDTSAENRIKFDKPQSDEPKAINTDDDAINSLFGNPTQETQPVEDAAPVNEVPVQSVTDDEDEENEGATVCIIDETATTVELTDDSAVYQNSSVDEAGAQVKKAPKQKVKFNALQIVLMCIVGVVLLWCVVFTVDHTLAAQGYSPVFCVETQKYEDGSANYTGLGYKIQFRFDSGDNLTQKCVPIWQDGPNDIADKQESGASFQ
ncbi:MAG: hypothetical protein UHL70_04785 [Acutalibacteraceae bacterium]|nr:hypothetical protein [Acutalibacteraceae bacterium]